MEAHALMTTRNEHAPWRHSCEYELEARGIIEPRGPLSALYFERFSIAYEKRRELTLKYAWAIPNEQALLIITRLSPIVEIGAGLGYWAKLLSERGADVVAYDLAPAGSKRENTWIAKGVKPYFPVEYGGASAVKRHQDRTLFLCWPYMNRMAERALAAYRGSTVVFIGEPRGGCCANDAFFKALNNEWGIVGSCKLLQWPGLHDELVVWKRRG